MMRKRGKVLKHPRRRVRELSPVVSEVMVGFEDVEAWLSNQGPAPSPERIGEAFAYTRPLTLAQAQALLSIARLCAVKRYVELSNQDTDLGQYDEDMARLALEAMSTDPVASEWLTIASFALGLVEGQEEVLRWN